jgi:uncharacterized protein
MNTPTTDSALDMMNKKDRINGQDFKALIEAALIWLRTNQQIVNSLNVFPVPDGDTGTNMSLTMQSAYSEIEESSDTNIGHIAHKVAQGALIGARGNSGVILSQLWRGFAKALDSSETMDAKLFVKALADARDTGYKGVVRPVEGTILTVAKDIAFASEAAISESENLLDLFVKIVKSANDSVIHTPELLPVLKQAGVVDSGAKGLFIILEGMLKYINKESLESPDMSLEPLSRIKQEHVMASIEPGQDYEIILDFSPFQPLIIEDYYENLSQMGTSIQVGEGEGIYRMHIHVPTENRYKPIDYTMQLGTIKKINIENLIEQTTAVNQRKTTPIKLTTIEPKQIAVVAVSPGSGISRIFASLGVNAIVEGGQTMNPSTEDILKSFEMLPTEKIIILPNNKNIILAAQAVTSMTVKKVSVIPSTSIPQGLSAILHYLPDGEYDDVVGNMKKALSDVITGEITRATRSVELNNVKVKEGEIISILDGTIVHSSSSVLDACLVLLEKADTSDMERITFFYGENIPEVEVNRIVDDVRKVYPFHEIEIHEGGQPHYYFLIAIE